MYHTITVWVAVLFPLWPAGGGVGTRLHVCRPPLKRRTKKGPYVPFVRLAPEKRQIERYQTLLIQLTDENQHHSEIL